MTIDDLLQVMECEANFLRGMCFDPSIAESVKKSLCLTIAHLDEAVEKMLKQLDGE